MTRRHRFRARYGAGPLHLLALVASFAIAGAAVLGWFQRSREVVAVLEWFAAAIVLHDLVLLPLYSLVDRIALSWLRRPAGGGPAGSVLQRVPPTPYLRVPAMLSGLLLAVFFPVIFGLGSQTELSASGIAESGYLARWLLATGVMFTISGVAFTIALARTGPPAGAAAPPADEPDPEPTTPGDVSPAPDGPDPDQQIPGDLAAEPPDESAPA